MNNKFYPTPKTLLDKIFSGVKWSKIRTVLEPSAGERRASVAGIRGCADGFPYWQKVTYVLVSS
ncbi:hypothetical protein B5G11_04825 [Drancourtella sp. An57]|uniref:hypothetical protein n=1 Tax=Drancourtella sp. An57 TaxID=1965647 RepID=UPI000B393017|nr:hypothetical protein [Drancourtella sp. An57]OUN71064.1 hypothetical protein B5G11_04825 [Drancourtella sp. An57]